MGTLDRLHYSQIYMAYSQHPNRVRIAGDTLPEDSMKVTVRGDGQWSMLPCLFNRTTPISEALASYFQKAKPGDLIKAHDRFAVFSEDLRWEGNLIALRPGEGYLFRRLGLGSVVIPFYHQTTTPAPQRTSRQDNAQTAYFSNPNASTNMTMIAKVEPSAFSTQPSAIRVYVGDELAGVAEPMDSLCFITIQSDRNGSPLRFETEDGIVLGPLSLATVNYAPDAHHGTLRALRTMPISLRRRMPLSIAMTRSSVR